MDLKRPEDVQFNFSMLKVGEHKKIVRLLVKNGFKGSTKNYQDYDFFSYCEKTNLFKFYKNKRPNKPIIGLQELRDIFNNIEIEKKIEKLKEKLK